jgi:outer membrane protein assembly factor BamB
MGHNTFGGGYTVTSSAIFIGIRGAVIALDRGTGQQLWKTSLKGGDFVTVMLDADRVIAATKGEVFCLDAATGHLLWRNELPGEGWGLIAIATASGSSSATPLFREKQVQEEAAGTTAIVAASS